jgi:DNA-binding FadR family transcriptional regulator
MVARIKRTKNRIGTRAARKEPTATRWGEAQRRTMKTSEVVALEIVRDIVAQRLEAGDRLPLESEMLVHYRVSRSSLREALRLLEVQGLIAIRPGPGAGTVVGKVLPGNLARTLTLYLHMSGATYNELLDAWTLSEPMLAELAAKNPDRKRVRDAMAPFLESSDTCHGPMRQIEAGLAFHDVVADLAGNQVLTLLLNVVGFIVTEQVLHSSKREALEDRIIDDHRALAEAIAAGKAQSARRLMEDHVRHLVDDFRALWPRLVGEKVQWR